MKTVTFECEECGKDFEDHPAATPPHYCPECNEAIQDLENGDVL